MHVLLALHHSDSTLVLLINTLTQHLIEMQRRTVRLVQTVISVLKLLMYFTTQWCYVLLVNIASQVSQPLVQLESTRLKSVRRAHLSVDLVPRATSVCLALRITPPMFVQLVTTALKVAQLLHRLSVLQELIQPKQVRSPALNVRSAQ